MLSSIFLLLLSIFFAHGELNQTVIEQTRSLLFPFDSIIVDGLFDVTLSQINDNSTSKLIIRAPAYVQHKIVANVSSNETLSIYINGSVTLHKQLELRIYYKSPLRRYTTRGVGNIKTDENGLISGGKEKFTLIHKGTGNVGMYLNVSEFEAHLSGTGDTRLWGQVREEVQFTVSGVGDVNALNLSAKKAKVLSSGVSTVRVAATEDIEIEIRGISTVFYRLPKGKLPSKSINTGLGQVIPVL